jgi:hypothetical protein
MKRRILAAGLMLIVFALVCLLSAPLSHAENPWDADVVKKKGDTQAYEDALDTLGSPGSDWTASDYPELYRYWLYINNYLLATVS